MELVAFIVLPKHAFLELLIEDNFSSVEVIGSSTAAAALLEGAFVLLMEGWLLVSNHLLVPPLLLPLNVIILDVFGVPGFLEEAFVFFLVFQVRPLCL
mmetsp:Transcript_42064/g.40334  ORF Transcript_42064/g.40334 Transcript_42064/m.40334 type:complete len:98 (-) Transcript_42064:58-351(-)